MRKIRLPSLRKSLSGVAIAAALALAAFAGVSGTASVAQAASPGPCDIYGAGGTGCVAAYSTVRALYHGYHGPLYQVTRASDGTKIDILTLPPGGYANAAAQTSFCAGTTCTITGSTTRPATSTPRPRADGGNGSPDSARSPTPCR